MKVRVDVDVLETEARRVSHRPAAARLTDLQVLAILGEAFGHGFAVGVAIEHLSTYGCRPVDVCKARVRDWDPATRTITYRDTKNTDHLAHTVHPLHAAKLSALAVGDPDDPLFVDPWNRPWALDKIGRATALTSWYKYNVGEILGGRDRRYLKGKNREPQLSKNGLPFGVRRPERAEMILAKNQRGIYCLKKYALTRWSEHGDNRTIAAMSGHRSLDVIDRYKTTNIETQQRLLDAVPLPMSENGGIPDGFVKIVHPFESPDPT